MKLLSNYCHILQTYTLQYCDGSDSSLRKEEVTVPNRPHITLGPAFSSRSLDRLGFLNGKCRNTVKHIHSRSCYIHVPLSLCPIHQQRVLVNGFLGLPGITGGPSQLWLLCLHPGKH
jgi:hypothetical protein